MANKTNRNKKIIYFSFSITLFILIGCKTKVMSVFHKDKNVGFNGNFEITRENLPVNWILYTPQTVPSGDFDIKMDNKEFKDGVQSLHFVVRTCASTGGWHSPGLSKELSAKPGDTYKISFWLKNNGSEFVVKTGAVSEFDEKTEIIFKSKEQIDNWKKFEYICIIPKKMKALRFEVNVLQPGDFWIDNVNIKKEK
jgi:hypothetical protein